MTPQPRVTFIVHGYAQACEALAVATELGVPICLRSAEEAGLALGAPWFLGMTAAALAMFPAVDAIAVLDCGPDAGAVLAAFRHQVKYVRADVATPVYRNLTDIARQCGASLIDDLWCRPVVDLDQVTEPLLMCRSLMKTT